MFISISTAEINVCLVTVTPVNALKMLMSFELSP